jgi:Fe(3+) dicitrate transport protein
MMKNSIIVVGFCCLVANSFAQQTLKDTIKVNVAEVVVKDQAEKMSFMRLRNVEADAIYASKKSEVIVLSEINANTASNNARQIFSKVAGLNIFENEGAGLQLGIGGRGLNPNRVSNFNTRQNGYDISADALGYPESYYTPATDLVERIEIVRGAASLQYGTQFGGFINFKLKKAKETDGLQLSQKNTMASFALFTSTTSVGYHKKKWNTYHFYQYKQGSSWRAYSNFNQHTYFGNFEYRINANSKIKFEQTYMYYLAQQPGGLTDAQFANDPSQVYRTRNWFEVKWALSAVTYDYIINSSWKINNKFFYLNAERNALGVLGFINRADPMKERDLLTDQYNNFGNETRLLHTFQYNSLPSTFILGARYYQGNTYRKQGLANANTTGNKYDFQFLNPESLDYSDFTFPSKNIALFSEFLFNVNPRWSIIPGLRYEIINTQAKGFYNDIQRNLAGTIIYRNRIDDNRNSSRNFALAGLGVSFKPTENNEIYVNISQNYRSINFNDMRVINPNLIVDPNLKDESGMSMDIGFRGSKATLISYDFTFFLLKYNDRIGTLLKSDTSTYQIYRYRTNVADSRNIGLESFVETDIVQWFKKDAKLKLNYFVNIAVINAIYLDGEDPSIKGNLVEYVPELNFKTGLQVKRNNFSGSLQYIYLTQQFADASNATETSNAVGGIIPAYSVVDLSMDYTWKKLSISAGINNVLNELYFTRRAEGYPGPGILPSDPRSYYVGLQYSINN